MSTPLERRALIFIVAMRDELECLCHSGAERERVERWGLLHVKATALLQEAGWLEEEKGGAR